MKVSVRLMGGLGNQLFQMAFLEYVSKNNTPCVEGEHISKHSTLSYFQTIFQNWSFGEINPSEEIFEDKLQPRDWEIHSDVRIIGYFQNYKYITPEFISKLTFDSSILSKYTIEKKVFIHVRGGDFFVWPHSDLHNMDLTTYYKKAIKLFPEGTEFVIFTNDKAYTESQEWSKNIPIIDENEIDSLFLMSKCAGGICANSSFSWWGAYLNPNRKLILPSKWFNDPTLYTKGYYFDGCTIVEV